MINIQRIRLYAIFLGLGLLAVPPLLPAQPAGRFAAGAVLGLNAAQIDGDTYAGYRKLGIQAGIQGLILLTRRLTLSTEILFSQRGARPSRKEKLEDFDNFIDIHLTYVEVPVLLNLSVGKAVEGLVPYRIFGGVSIGRLINTKIRETGDSVRFYPFLNMREIKDDFSLFDTSLVLGLQRQFDRHLGLFFKHTLTLKRLYTPTDPDDLFNELEPFHFTFGASYAFF